MYLTDGPCRCRWKQRPEKQQLALLRRRSEWDTPIWHSSIYAKVSTTYYQQHRYLPACSYAVGSIERLQVIAIGLLLLVIEAREKWRVGQPRLDA